MLFFSPYVSKVTEYLAPGVVQVGTELQSLISRPPCTQKKAWDKAYYMSEECHKVGVELSLTGEARAVNINDGAHLDIKVQGFWRGGGGDR